MSTIGFDELWDHLNTGDESVMIEAKRASKIDKSILQTVSAFANTPDRGGGYLLLGVVAASDSLFKDEMYEVVGVSDSAKVQADLATQCRDTLQPAVRPQVWPEQRDGKTVLVAFIPESAAQDKPVYISSEGLPRGAYLRIASTDQHCTDDDLAVLFQNRQTTTFDESCVEGTTIEDIESTAVVEYRRARREVNPSAGELRLSDVDLLHALHATTSSKGRTGLTVAGLMLFGKEAALRRHFPMSRVDYIRVEGREWVPDPEKRYVAVEMRGPLLTLIPRVVQQVLADIPMTFSLGATGIHRRDVPLIPRTVIREAIVNSLMHRTYRTRSPVQVIRYANRIEIRNPGHSLKPDDRLGEPGSVSRNEKIAAVLHEAGLAETKGTGIRVMRDAMSRANLTLPIFESDRDKDGFTVRLLVHHLLGPEDLAWLAGFKECGLSADEAKALLVLREMGAIDNAVYRDINRVDTLTASRALQRLRELGLVEKKGKGTATYYVPTSRLSEGEPQPLTKAGGGQPDGSTGQPDGLKGQSDGLAAQPAGPVGQSDVLAGLPAPLSRSVSQLGGRPSPEAVRQVIRALCGWRPLRLSELASILSRSPGYLRGEYLYPMVKDGVLEYTHPENRAHPQQAYRTRANPSERKKR